MNRRGFFRSLLGLMAIPFVGLKKPKPTGELPLTVIRDCASGELSFPIMPLSRMQVLSRYPYAESDLHRQYRTGKLGNFNLWQTGELGTVQGVKLRPIPERVEPTLAAIMQSRADRIVFEGADKDQIAHTLFGLFPLLSKEHVQEKKRIILTRDGADDFGRACGYNWSLEG